MRRRHYISMLNDQSPNYCVRFGRHRPAHQPRSPTHANADDRITTERHSSLVIGTPIAFRHVGVRAALGNLRRVDCVFIGHMDVLVTARLLTVAVGDKRMQNPSSAIAQPQWEIAIDVFCSVRSAFHTEIRIAHFSWGFDTCEMSLAKRSITADQLRWSDGFCLPRRRPQGRTVHVSGGRSRNLIAA